MDRDESLKPVMRAVVWLSSLPICIDYKASVSKKALAIEGG